MRYSDLTGGTKSGDGAGPAPRLREQRDAYDALDAGILIVEDELMVAWSFEGQLEDAGYTVAGIVATGEGALERVAKQAPDLVLMDINLGEGIDGIETARRIRAIAPVPIVFISAYSDAETRARIDETVPGSAFLSKPITFAALDRAIRDVTERRH